MIAKATTQSKTAKVIDELLKQHTGSSILDSGGSPLYSADGTYQGSTGGYGRWFERLANKCLDDEPSCNLRFSAYNGRVEIDLTLSTYHWLLERCEFDPKLDRVFQRFADRKCNEDKCWLQLMEEFPEHLGSLVDRQGNPRYGTPRGIYGDGEPFVINTYNAPSLVEQTLQFLYFTIEGQEYALISSANGCDVRGSYSRPRLFRTGCRSELDILSPADGAIFCTGSNHHHHAQKHKIAQESQTLIEGVDVEWIDFEGHHDHYWTTDSSGWFYQGSCGVGYDHKRLDRFEVVELGEEPEDFQWKPGILMVDESKNGYCPWCGARLAAGDL